MLTITPEDNAVLRAGDFVPVIEPGAREVWIGASSSSARPGLLGTFTVTGNTPLAACGTASAWTKQAWGGAARA